MAMTRAKAAERDSAIETLRGFIKPGQEVHCILRHVARSGMQRRIDLVVECTNDDGTRWLRTISSLVARACGYRKDDNGQLVIGGCGFDAGHQAVYDLSSTLWPNGAPCIGEGCHSNDHNNGDRDYTPHSEARPHLHSDGGYMLRHHWL